MEVNSETHLSSDSSSLNDDSNFKVGTASLNPKFANPQKDTAPVPVPMQTQPPKAKSHKRLRNYFAHRENDKPSVPVHVEQQQHEAVSSSGNESTTATGMTRRCICNLSQCVSTNYMCKSEKRIYTNEDGSTTEVDAGCFVEELPKSQFGVTEANGRVTSARRGCVEHLNREKLKLCSDRTGAPMHCCFNEDMCNYPKTFFPPQFHTPNLNRLGYDPQNGARGIPSVQQPMNLDQQVWIRAALICVPICGLMILMVLILVARRLLKSDDEYKETVNASSAGVGAGGDGAAATMYHPTYNKYGGYYYPSPPPPPIHEYPFIKPVFMPSEYKYNQDEYFSPVEIQRRQQRQGGTGCCCHHNGNNNREPDENNSLLAEESGPGPSQSSSRTGSIGRTMSTLTANTASEDLVTSANHEEVCQCSSDPDDIDTRCHCHCRCADGYNHCNMIRPPSVLFAEGGSFLSADQESPTAPVTATATTLKKFNTLLSKLLLKKNENCGPRPANV